MKSCLQTANLHIPMPPMESTSNYNFPPKKIYVHFFSFNSVLQNYVLVIILTTKEIRRKCKTILAAQCLLYYSHFLSSSLSTFFRCCLKICTCQCIHTLKTQMEKVTFTFCLQPSKGESSPESIPISITCMGLQLCVKVGVFYGHFYGIFICCVLGVCSLGWHECAPMSTACLSLLPQDLGTQSWQGQLFSGLISPSETKAAPCLKQRCGRIYELYFEQFLTQTGTDYTIK